MKTWNHAATSFTLVLIVLSGRAIPQELLSAPPRPFYMSKDRRDRDIWLLKWREEIGILRRIGDKSPERSGTIAKRISRINEQIKDLDSVEEVEDYRVNHGALQLPTAKMLGAARLLEALGAEVMVNRQDSSDDFALRRAGKRKYVIELRIDGEQWIGTPEEIKRVQDILPIMGLAIKAHNDPERVLKQFLDSPAVKTTCWIALESNAMTPELLVQTAGFQLRELAVSSNNLQVADYVVIKRLKHLEALLLLHDEGTIAPAHVIKALQRAIAPVFIYQAIPRGWSYHVAPECVSDGGG